MTNIEILPDVVIIADELVKATAQYEELNYYLRLLSKFSLSILKGEMTDNYDQLYYKLLLPCTKLIPDDEPKIRTKINKMKKLLLPESIRIQQHNNDIQYQIYKKSTGNKY